jgi:sigma-B regulation protein RsbU (phosphoserine phosphatase)
VPGPKIFQERAVELGKGGVLVLYSDGLIDARPELTLNNALLADQLKGMSSAREMVDRLVGLTQQQGPQTDDIMVLVVSCTE